MNKTELIAAVAEKAGIQKKVAAEAVAATFDVITETMKAGDKVQIPGFGVFEAKHRAARTGYNPQTKKPVEIAASKAPSVKFFKSIKDFLNQ